MKASPSRDDDRRRCFDDRHALGFTPAPTGFHLAIGRIAAQPFPCQTGRIGRCQIIIITGVGPDAMRAPPPSQLARSTVPQPISPICALTKAAAASV